MRRLDFDLAVLISRPKSPTRPSENPNLPFLRSFSPTVRKRVLTLFRSNFATSSTTFLTRAPKKNLVLLVGQPELGEEPLFLLGHQPVTNQKVWYSCTLTHLCDSRSLLFAHSSLPLSSSSSFPLSSFCPFWKVAPPGARLEESRNTQGRHWGEGLL